MVRRLLWKLSHWFDSHYEPVAYQDASPQGEGRCSFYNRTHHTYSLPHNLAVFQHQRLLLLPCSLNSAQRCGIPSYIFNKYSVLILEAHASSGRRQPTHGPTRSYYAHYFVSRSSSASPGTILSNTGSQQPQRIVCDLHVVGQSRAS